MTQPTQYGTSIPADVAQSVLESARNASAVGTSQFLTPRPFAKVCAIPLPDCRTRICDLQAGTGSLLYAAANSTTQSLLACDITNIRAHKEEGDTLDLNRITADTTLFYGLMNDVEIKFDLFTLNPPFSAHWERSRLAGLLESECVAVREAFSQPEPRLGADLIDSTPATFMIALDRCSYYGEGFLIANQATLERLILNKEAPYHALAQHVWGNLTLDGNPMTGIKGHNFGEEFVTGVIYFSASHESGCSVKRHSKNLAEFEQNAEDLNRNRFQHHLGNKFWSSQNACADTMEKWLAIREEWKARQGEKPAWNIWLEPDGTIKTHLSAFENCSTKVDKEEAGKLFELNGQRPLQLVMQSSTRLALRRAVDGTLWRVHPDLPAKVEAAIADYNTERAPLYPLNNIQSIGYLDEESQIECVNDLVLPGGGIAPKVLETLRKYEADEGWGRNGIWSELARMKVGDTQFMGWALRQDPAFKIPENFGSESASYWYWEKLPDPKLLRQLVDSQPKCVVFKAGKAYTLDSKSHMVQRIKHKPDLKGDLQEFQLSGMELALYIKDEFGNTRCFMDAKCKLDNVKVEGASVDFTLQDMAQHFRWNRPADVAVTHPEEYAKNLAELDEIERLMNVTGQAKQFRLRKFQKEDISRAGIHHGMILAWEMGCGKSLGSILYALLKSGRVPGTLVPAKPVLIVAPGHLIQHWVDEAKSKFGLVVTKIDTQDTFLSLTDCGRSTLLPGLYVTSFTQLGLNGTIRAPKNYEEYKRACQKFGVEPGPPSYQFLLLNIDAPSWRPEREFFNRIPAKDQPEKFSVGDIYMSKYEVKAIYQHAPDCFGGVGEEKNGIRCVAVPRLSDLMTFAFDTVIVDESVRLKNRDTHMASGVIDLQPKHRLVMTGEPIKNRLSDLFELVRWAAGGTTDANPRFPYSSDPAEKETFANEFLVSERNLTAEKAENHGRKKKDRDRKGKWRRGKVTPEVCNVHKLWKLLAPNILRRRKCDIGEELVPKMMHTVRCPMGEEQAKVYEYHLGCEYLDKNGDEAYGARLQALRCAATSPHSEHLKGKRSNTDYVPKLATALTLIEQAVRSGEQIVLFSSFHEPLDTLSRRLTEAGVPHDVLDGRKSEKVRGKASSEFKKGRPIGKPVLLAGKQAMGEGHSWPKCCNGIDIDYDWAADIVEQADGRIHRLDSEKPVNVHRLVSEGTIDLKMESMHSEKVDSKDLVLDGRLIDKLTEETSIRTLLGEALREFENVKTIPESTLEKDWPALRAKLVDAYLESEARLKRPAAARLATPAELKVPELRVEIPVIPQPSRSLMIFA